MVKATGKSPTGESVPLSVMIGLPVYRNLEIETTLALIGTLDLLRREQISCSLGVCVGVSIPAMARNQVADNFLKSDAQYLFWIDSDIAWNPPDFLRILRLAEHNPIVHCGYPTKTVPSSVCSDGLGFCCVSRTVMTEMASKAPLVFADENSTVSRIFHGAGKWEGEDKNFYEDAKALGFKTMLVPDVSLGHIGAMVYRAVS